MFFRLQSTEFYEMLPVTKKKIQPNVYRNQLDQWKIEDQNYTHTSYPSYENNDEPGYQTNGLKNL